MIECVFTLDYEIFGNGEGSLHDHVYAPAERLRELFLEHGARFVPFVEVAEFEMIEAHGTDPCIELVKRQLREMHGEGFPLELHLHPQWYNGRFEDGRWTLDDKEYNLCTLPRERIGQIVDRALAYLRRTLQAPGYTPLAFRAGNWLFQPTKAAAEVLVERGIRLDSSVFKGGVRHQHHLDYRRALKNGYYWRFDDRVDVADSNGPMIELPIHTQMVPFWRMGTPKRLALERQNLGSAAVGRKGLYRLLDMSRLRHPLKFDFCRMTFVEMTSMLGASLAEDCRHPGLFKPLVAIGHTKELVDLGTISQLLTWLRDHGIKISTFSDVYARCSQSLPDRRPSSA